MSDDNDTPRAKPVAVKPAKVDHAKAVADAAEALATAIGSARSAGYSVAGISIRDLGRIAVSETKDVK